MRPFSVIACVLLGLSAVWTARGAEPADPAEKPKHTAAAADRFWPRGPGVSELKKDLDLTDDQVNKAKTDVETVKKAFEAKPEVVAAEDDVKKTEEAYKAAEAKLRALKEGNMYLDELKKTLLNSLPDDKKEKALPLLHIKGAAKAEKKDAKADAPKPETKDPNAGGGEMGK
jgi:hypothetical protein